MFERLKATLGLASGSVELRAPAAMHYATDYGRDILHNSPDGWEHTDQWLWWVDGPNAGQGYGNPPPEARGVSGADALPAVMRCTSLIADTLAGLPWRVYHGFQELPTPRFMSDPQRLRPDGRAGGALPPMPDALSQVEFWANFITAALWFGDTFAYSLRGNVAGQVLDPLFILNPQDVEWREGEY